VLPAGAALRARGRMEWPQSGLSMSLAGFDHVFRDSVTISLGPELQCKVVPPPVLALLKMASYADDPYGRAKDLVDLRRLLGRYERESDRLFSDAVFKAELPDIEFAGAFLLGVDVRAIATADDRDIIARFLSQVQPKIDDAPTLDLDGRDTAQFQQQIAAFRQGLPGDHARFAPESAAPGTNAGATQCSVDRRAARTSSPPSTLSFSAPLRPEREWP